jgi:hypothetical protein
VTPPVAPPGEAQGAAPRDRRFLWRGLLLGAALLLLAYAPLIPWLGFYWDDWPTLWYGHLLGPGGYPEVFTSDRPLLGWLFRLTTPLIGSSAAGWQVFGLVGRGLSALTFAWLVAEVWPGVRRAALWAGVLFILYPGFNQQYIALTYSHAWLIQAVYLLSLGLWVAALRRPRQFWPLYLLSLGLAAAVLFTDEYFFGLELLRPVLAWLVLRPQPPAARLKAIGVRWTPFLLLMVAFLGWRLVLHPTPRGDVQLLDQLAAAPLLTPLRLLGTILGDVVESGLLAWLRPLEALWIWRDGPLVMAAALALMVAAAVLVGWLAGAAPEGEAVAAPRRGREFLLVGGLALLAGGPPFWATGLPIMLRFPWDRFTLALMPGACLLLLGLLASLPRRGRLPWANLALAALTAAAVGFHFWSGFQYRRDWEAQRSFIWQLTWRAPGLESGTTILTAALPFQYYTDNSLTAPLNWTYASPAQEAVLRAPQPPRSMPFNIWDIKSRVRYTLLVLKPHQPIEQPYRLTEFHGSTDQALVVMFQPPACLKVLDPALDSGQEKLPFWIEKALPLSDVGLIQTDVPAARPPAALGPEPPHDWCYDFQQADRLRSAGDWEALADLADGALARSPGRAAAEASELAVMLDGYAHLGRWEPVISWSQQADTRTNRARTTLCRAWRRWASLPDLDPARAQAAMDALGCPSQEAP